MMTKTLKSKILMLVLAVLASLAAHADNYLYLEGVSIPSSAVGNEITIPVKASFDSYVSIWDVQFTLPEGLTLRRVRAGSDMNVSYCNDFGDEQISVGQFSFISGASRCIGMLDLGIDHQLNEFSEYDPCGTVKWGPGQYDEMLLLTIRVDDGFNGGDIIINTKTSCGYDTRLMPNPFSPSSPETVDGVILGDANCNGEINIADLTWYIDYFSANETDYVLGGDIVHDGVNDILDVTKLRDVLLFGEWYDGYVMTQAEKVINIPEPATNYLYVDDVRIPASAVGSEVTIPVKASFDTFVSFWDVQFTLPEGLKLRGLREGSDMNVSYCDEFGEEQVSQSMLVTGSDITHCIGIQNSNSHYQLNENGEYEFCGLVKWSPGQYNEMLLLTVRVEDGFNGGDIIINTKTTCGYDTRLEPNTLTPSTLEYGDEHYPGDVNHDGNVTISDFTCILNYLLGENDYFCSQCADVVQDGAIDIMDACKLMDLLLTGVWYDGYVLTQAEKVINIPEPVNNYLYVDDVSIPASALGSEITIPVKASFDTFVSFWDVQFTLPEGLTLRRMRAGSDMNVSYCDEFGEEQVSQAMLATGSDLTHCIGVQNYNCDYQLNENGEYELCGLVKWSAGQYEEMLLLTVRVEDGFCGGDIIINTKTTCGYDTRLEPNTLTPSTLEYGDEHYPGDVNQDGNISISDFTCLLNYLLDVEDVICSQCADVVQDGAIDIMDACKLMDLLLTGEWYDGYVLTQAEKVFILPEPILSGDVNGDGFVTIGDVTSLVDILLEQYGYYDVHADLNGDGHVTISDVTILVDILLGNR